MPNVRLLFLPKSDSTEKGIRIWGSDTTGFDRIKLPWNYTYNLYIQRLDEKLFRLYAFLSVAVRSRWEKRCGWERIISERKMCELESLILATILEITFIHTYQIYIFIWLAQNFYIYLVVSKWMYLSLLLPASDVYIIWFQWLRNNAK